MMNCDFSDARDCSECCEPICRHMQRRNDWDDEWGGDDAEPDY